MGRYIAFLRAINVGGRTVKMTVLRDLFEELELHNVETFIASGNVLFDSNARSAGPLEERIEGHLEQKLGYAVPTFIRTPAQLQAISTHQPASRRHRGATPHNALYVGFLKGVPSRDATSALATLQNEVDAFDVTQREIYWSFAMKLTESTVSGALLERTLAMPVTFRNITTIRRLVADA
jgi:Uncharacterized protein conserved in bacteria